MKIKIDVEKNNRWEKFPAEMEKRLETALLKGGETVRAEAVLHCPVDTGRLRSSLAVEQVDPVTVLVGTNLEYGIYVEFGTGSLGDDAVAHTTKKGWVYFDPKRAGFFYTKGHAAQPFLVPALLAKKEEVTEAVRKALSDL